MGERGNSTSSDRGSAWDVETNPKYVQAWIESLSPFSNLDSTRELYQGLCALNRETLDPKKRYTLTQMYEGPVREACASLQSSFHSVAFPMPTKLRRVAAFVCQLNREMARAYMLCLQNLSMTWLMPWRRRQMLVMPAERALYYLSEVLLRSYQVYLPYSADIWRSAHAAYRLAELHGRHNERIDVHENKEAVSTSVSQRYRRLLLLGTANPYQMPFGECMTVHRFLGQWAHQVPLMLAAPQHDNGACFLVDLSTDTPPVAAGRTSTNIDTSNFRWLDISELTRTLHGMLRRLERGESATSLQLGVECLDSVCHDMLQRLHRVFGQAVSRRHSRIKRHETVMICAGIGALHFFAGGQKPFAAPESQAASDVSTTVDMTDDETYLSLDEPSTGTSPTATPESFRVDRWHVHDVSPQGLMLSQESGSSVKFRIGDLLGIQRMSVPGHWSAGLVRWCKTLGEKGTEIGVELIAPDVTPTSITSTTDSNASQPALMLPAVEATRHPASVLVTRGAVHVGNDCFLEGADHVTRRVRILDTIERTNSIEQVIVGNVL